MRLTCRRFAYLQLIQRTLFEGIQLVASPEHLELLTRTDVSHVASLVKRVTFVAPLQSWTLTYGVFKEVILAQAIRKHVLDHSLATGSGSYDFTHDPYQTFMDQNWNGQSPFSRDQICVGYDNYHRNALQVRDLIIGEKLKGIWAGTIQALPNVHSVRFASVEYQNSCGSQFPVQPDCIVRPHHHDNVHRLETCQKVAAPVGDALFATATASLVMANVTIEELNVECVMTGDFGWRVLPDWSKLNLSRVQRFDFQPRVHPVRVDCGYDVIAKNAADAISAVLRSCRYSIEKLSYGSSCPMHWPGDKVISLPRLTHLHLGKGNVRTRNLKRWIAQMPSLKHIQLIRSQRGDYRWYGWRYVFDAVRNHRNAMEVEFYNIDGDVGAKASIHYRTDDVSKYLGMEEKPIIWVDIDRYMALYMSGIIDWNERLAEWFPQG